jgi:hypothetical protein
MTRLALVAPAVLAAVIASGCGGAGATTNCKEPPDLALLKAVRAYAGPVQLPNGPDKGNAARLTITACETSSSEATATLTVFGLHDRSVLDSRHGLKLEFKSGTWKVTGDAPTRRCQPGHGSQDFSGAKCT